MKKPKVIVSFTSYPARIALVDRTVESILGQTTRPDKIVLYLATEQFPGKKLPGALAKLAKNNPEFIIKWVDKNLRSYKKLIYAVVDFPDDIIITIDDDILYPNHMIADLMETHNKYPDAICGCRVRRIPVFMGIFKKYRRWMQYKKKRILFYGAYPKFKNFATTGGGTLFPPRSLHPDVVRDDIFMETSPTTDDMWFWACAVLNGTKTAPSKQIKHLNVVAGSQEDNLFKNNLLNQINDKSLANILKRYPEIKKRMRI